MVVKGKDPLNTKIKQQLTSYSAIFATMCSTTNHVISWLVPSRVEWISVLLETTSNVPVNHQQSIITRTSRAKETFDI